MPQMSRRKKPIKTTANKYYIEEHRPDSKSSTGIIYEVNAPSVRDAKSYVKAGFGKPINPYDVDVRIKKQVIHAGSTWAKKWGKVFDNENELVYLSTDNQKVRDYRNPSIGKYDWQIVFNNRYLENRKTKEEARKRLHEIMNRHTKL